MTNPFAAALVFDDKSKARFYIRNRQSGLAPPCTSAYHRFALGDNQAHGAVKPAGWQPFQHTGIVAQPDRISGEACQEAVIIPLAIAQPEALAIKRKRRDDAKAAEKIR